MNFGGRNKSFIFAWVVLIAAISLSLVGGAVAEVNQMCPTMAAQGGAAPAPVKAGCYCCCKDSATNECSTGLQGGCRKAPAGETSQGSPPPIVQNLSGGPSASPVCAGIPSSSYEANHRSVFGQETVYLVNARLIC
jgi:hypothetical protein